NNLLLALLRSPALIGVAHSSGGSVLDDALSPNGRLLAFRNNDGTVVFLNAKTLRRVGQYVPPDTAHGAYGAIGRSVNALSFSPNGRTLAVGSSGGSSGLNRAVTLLLDAQSHRVRAADGSGYLASEDVLFAPDGRTLVTGDVLAGSGSPPSEVL